MVKCNVTYRIKECLLLIIQNKTLEHYQEDLIQEVPRLENLVENCQSITSSCPEINQT